MTKIQAAVLYARWNRQIDPPLCAHPHVELEHIASAYAASTYHCLACGSAMARILLAIPDRTSLI
jgi:hypothetical protein